MQEDLPLIGFVKKICLFTVPKKMCLFKPLFFFAQAPYGPGGPVAEVY